MSKVDLGSLERLSQASNLKFVLEMRQALPEIIEELRALWKVAEAARIYIEAINREHECTPVSCDTCDEIFVAMCSSKNELEDALKELEGGEK